MFSGKLRHYLGSYRVEGSWSGSADLVSGRRSLKTRTKILKLCIFNL